MLNTPFAPWPSYTEDEANAVSAVLLSNKVNYWTGTHCREFEKEFAQWCNTKYAIALSNGTLALDLALYALDVGPGDEVIVTPRTFIASVSCVVNAGAIPVFADVCLQSGNITPQTIALVITPKTKAIICVHLAGWPCDMDGIMALANQHGIKVIEDCAQAHGAKYKDKPVGSIGHIGAWSFCQDKIMSTGGEGGMVTTNDETLWRKMWAFKDHGKSYEAVYERQQAKGFRWLHESFGTNWRMLEMQAVIGRLQLNKMPEWTAQRNKNALSIISACNNLSAIQFSTFNCGASCQCNGSYQSNALVGCTHAYYKLYANINLNLLADGWTRDKIIEAINALGVPCYQGTCYEVYLEKAFDNTGFRPKKPLVNAHILGEISIMFLVHPTISQQDIKKTGEAIVEVITKAQLI